MSEKRSIIKKSESYTFTVGKNFPLYLNVGDTLTVANASKFKEIGIKIVDKNKF